MIVGKVNSEIFCKQFDFYDILFQANLSEFSVGVSCLNFLGGYVGTFSSGIYVYMFF